MQGVRAATVGLDSPGGVTTTPGDVTAAPDGVTASPSGATATPGHEGSAPSARQTRRGPAPIASFDHDVSEESSPESKASFQLPEIREHRAASPARAAPECGAALGGTGAALGGAAPRIDISRASSSSHHDSRDSSPEMFAAAADGERGLGFREDGALDLRSSTEELAFLEPEPAGGSAGAGRSTRGNSVGSVTSALSSRAASPRVLRETSFCGPKPLTADPEPSPAHVRRALSRPDLRPAPLPLPGEVPPPARPALEPHRLLTEATVEPMVRRASAPSPRAAPSRPDDAPKEEPKPRRRTRRRSETDDRPVVYRSENRDKSVIRIRLKPDHEYEDEPDRDSPSPPPPPRSPDRASAPAPPPAARSLAPSPSPSRRSSPAASRKSSFCSLFRRSPEPPAPRAERARSRSRDRDRSATPPSRARGSVLSLFRGAPRRSAASPGPEARALSPATLAAIPPRVPAPPGAERLKYYEESPVIHIPLHSPPEERAAVTLPAVSVPVSAPTDTTPTVSATTTAPRAAHPARASPPAGVVIIPLHSPTDAARPPVESEDDAPPPRAPSPVVSTRRPTESPETPSDERFESTTPDRPGSPFGIARFDDREPFESPRRSGDEPDGTAAGPDPESDSDADRANDPFRTNNSDAESDSRTLPDDDESREESPWERRRLVIESDEELPWVATTLPQERPLAWPMRSMGSRSPPARDERALRRPRARPRLEALRIRTPPESPPAESPPPLGSLSLRLPTPAKRGGGRTACVTISGSAARQEERVEERAARWVDVTQLAERRPAARRIQTVTTAVSYVEPAECRCECHRSGSPRPARPGAGPEPEDERPLLRSRRGRPHAADGCTSDSSAEGALVADVGDALRQERA